MDNLVFIKWGGSLITEKDKPFTVRPNVIGDLSEELAQLIRSNPNTKFVLGHGSGSFGHSVAKHHHTIEGVHSSAGWHGFTEVWHAARTLNNIIMNSLQKTGISCMAFQPSSSFLTKKRQIQENFNLPIERALESKILPVVYGDVVFDEILGGSILSTEDIFNYLAKILFPTKILLAGLEESIWLDFPEKNNGIRKITNADFDLIKNNIGQSASVDVTGGMIEKVQVMLDLITEIPNLKIAIFSGKIKGNITRAFNNQEIGTWIERE